MLKNNVISEDMLEEVSGGAGDRDGAPTKIKCPRCPHCGSFLKKNGVYYRCTDCRLLFDEFGNEIGGDD